MKALKRDAGVQSWGRQGLGHRRRGPAGPRGAAVFCGTGVLPCGALVLWLVKVDFPALIDTGPFAFGPLLMLERPLYVLRLARQRRARAGRRASLRRSTGTPTPLRCSVSWPVAKLTPLASERCVQTDGDKSVHEARCARGPRALCSSAPKRRPPTCPSTPLRRRFRCSTEKRTRCNCWSRPFAFRRKLQTVAARRAVAGRGDFGGDEQRRACGLARSAFVG